MFTTNYYCLVAGLKEYSLDADTKGFDAKAIVGEILEGVDGADADAVRAKRAELPKFWRAPLPAVKKLDCKLIHWDLVDRFANGTATKRFPSSPVKRCRFVVVIVKSWDNRNARSSGSSSSRCGIVHNHTV